MSLFYKSQEIRDGTFLWYAPSQIKFEAFSLPEFSIYIKIEHLEFSQLTTEVLLFFGMTYLCEKIFSAIKSKCRNRLQLYLRVAD
jgi:hypothetical protein